MSLMWRKNGPGAEGLHSDAIASALAAAYQR